MSPVAVIVLVVTAIVVISLLVVASKRRSRDGVDSFRRQIDALSPEARRPVVDQVQSVAESHEHDDHDSATDDDPDDDTDA